MTFLGSAYVTTVVVVVVVVIVVGSLITLVLATVIVHSGRVVMVSIMSTITMTVAIPWYTTIVVAFLIALVSIPISKKVPETLTDEGDQAWDGSMT